MIIVDMQGDYLKDWMIFLLCLIGASILMYVVYVFIATPQPSAGDIMATSNNTSNSNRQPSGNVLGAVTGGIGGGPEMGGGPPPS